jgi:transposase
MAARSKVELFEQIRKAHDREALSIRELSKRFEVHRRTVRLAIDSALPPPRKEWQHSSPAMAPYRAVIEEWLEADKTAPRKQRHAAHRIWERLVDEHGATVAESTVRRYIRLRRASEPISRTEVMVPQSHRLGGEAEVDFGDVGFYLEGQLVTGHLFVMRLCASGKAFHRVYGNEAQEAFLDGHVRAFEHFGGVPEVVRYDNLKPAVIRVMRGRQRTETERFIAMRSHYRFESVFCRPGLSGAHEKGGVEGEVGRFRRRYLVPVPKVSSLGELNEHVDRGDESDDARRVNGRHLTVSEHFAMEAPELRGLPAEDFGAYSLLNCRVDRRSRICVRQCFYSVPVRYVGRRLDVRLGAERIEALDGAHLVASHPRALARGSEVLDLDHYLEVLSIKPGAFPGSTPLERARRTGAFSELHDRFLSEARKKKGDSGGYKAIIDVLLAERNLSRSAVAQGMQAALHIGSVDVELVLIEARRSESAQPAAVVDIALAGRFDRPAPTLGSYDELLEARP